MVGRALLSALAVVVFACPVAAETNADQRTGWRVVTPEIPFLHSWRATLDYGQAAGPIEDVASRVGYSREQAVKVGLGFGIGDRGFAQFDAGRGRRDTKRALTFEDMKGDENDTSLGVTGGLFLLPFFAAGISFQYRWGDGEDVFTNRVPATPLVVIGRDETLRRTAPFALLTAPVGPVQATLIGAYVDVATDTDYTKASVASDSGRVKASVIDAALAWRVIPKIEIEGSVGWTHVSSQRVQSDALALDTDTGTAGARVTYRLTEALDASLRGSHDIANDRGDGFRFGGGLAYRF